MQRLQVQRLQRLQAAKVRRSSIIAMAASAITMAATPVLVTRRVTTRCARGGIAKSTGRRGATILIPLASLPRAFLGHSQTAVPVWPCGPLYSCDYCSWPDDVCARDRQDRHPVSASFNGFMHHVQAFKRVSSTSLQRMLLLPLVRGKTTKCYSSGKSLQHFAVTIVAEGPDYGAKLLLALWCTARACTLRFCLAKARLAPG